MELKDVVAIDGPTASGKSLSSVLAGKLGWRFLDSGSVYRTATLIVDRSGVDIRNRASVEEVLRESMPRISFEGNKIALDGQVLRDEIRTPEIGRLTPLISHYYGVRQLIIPIQRKFAELGPTVADGRDMASVVFPDAAVKIFLTADLITRGFRRLRQYQSDGNHSGMTLKDVIDAIRLRDDLDSRREHSPLKQVPDAVLINSTLITPEQVVERMLEVCREKIGHTAGAI